MPCRRRQVRFGLLRAPSPKRRAMLYDRTHRSFQRSARRTGADCRPLEICCGWSRSTDRSRCTRGRLFIATRGEWIRYRTPEADGAEYIAICLLAFSPATVHRSAWKWWHRLSPVRNLPSGCPRGCATTGLELIPVDSHRRAVPLGPNHAPHRHKLQRTGAIQHGRPVD